MTRSTRCAAVCDIRRRLEDTLDRARDYGARWRAIVVQGGKPMHGAVMLIRGGVAASAMANSSRATAESRVLPIEALARKPA
jgi:hypothetical protein